MRQIYKTIKRAGPSDSAVLILGESGTGKELAANAIVRESTRKDKPFIKVNCAALTESIVESELFGHTKSAFTGAVSDKKGRFEVANHGTIFLDEVGDLPLAVQAKLLRVLQDGTFEPVGSATPLTVDVRVIAATNSDLAASINEGKFRADLFYRLNVISLKLPPLRDRREDIPLLAKHFLKKHSRHKEVELEESAMAKLKSHSWRGNIRSLENCIERAVAMCDGNIIREADLDLKGDIPQPEPRSIDRWSFERFVSEEVIGNSNENEYRLLYLMMKTPGRPVSDEDLQKIGYDVLCADAETRKKAEKAVRMAFSRLRAKLKNCPDCGWVLPRRTRYVVPK